MVWGFVAVAGRYPTGSLYLYALGVSNQKVGRAHS